MIARAASLVRVGSLVLIALLAASSGSATPAAAQDASSGSDQWVVPRTEYGHPDLQGEWTNATLTPIERPEGMPAVLTPQQVAGIEGQREQFIEENLEPSDPDRGAPPVGGVSLGNPLFDAAAGGTGGYNISYLEAGRQVAVFDGEPRSSLITEPSNGRLPPLTDEAKQRIAQRRAAVNRFDEFDHPELRSLGERCIKSFGSNLGPPMLPNYFYNNNYTIVQTPDRVMILTEMVHDVRVVELGEPDPPPDHIRPWFGYSWGHWEGDTLVVETTHLPEEQRFANMNYYRGGSDDMKVIERFYRAGEEKLNYEFTVVDPEWYTEEWGGQVPMRPLDGRIYEYACHEHNHALFNVLSGARAQEQQQQEEGAGARP